MEDAQIKTLQELIKTQVLIIIFLLLLVSASGQERTFSRQIIFKEMARHNARTFLEDSDGFVWIGGNSLFRYDGYEVQPYQSWHSDSGNHRVGAVYALLEDRQQRIWIGASNGLFRYDKQTNELKRLLTDRPTSGTYQERILSLYQDQEGRIWVGDRQHLYVIDDSEQDAYRMMKGYELGSRRQGVLGFTAIVEGRRGGIWASSNRGLWLIGEEEIASQFLPEKWQHKLEEFLILDMAMDDRQTLWLATSDGLWVFDMQDSLFSKIPLPFTAGKVITSILIGAESECWIGTEAAGLLKLQNGNFSQYTHDSDNPYSLFDNSIQALMLDRFGSLWIGTLIGSNQINFAQQQFPFYQIDPGPYQYDNYVHRVMQDSLGGFWFRLLRLGLGYCPRLDGPLEILLRPPPNSTDEEIKSFCLDADGDVWVLTLTNGLYRFKKGQTSYQHIDLGDSLKVAYAQKIVADQLDNRYLWFSTQFGLCRVNRFTFAHKWFPPKTDWSVLNSNSLGVFIQSGDGNFWGKCFVGTTSRIWYFDREEAVFGLLPELRDEHGSIDLGSTRDWALVPGNKLWYGTTSGLFIVDPEEKTITPLGPKVGFPLQYVLSITPDLEGNIWFVGEYQLCKYDGSQYHCTDVREGIEDFNYRCAALGKDGRITFGGDNGIYSFYPQDIIFQADIGKPRVQLIQYKVLNEAQIVGRAYERLKEITLPYRDNVLTLEFSAIHFPQPERLRYKHRLVPFEKKWVETGSDERQATYTNLTPGSYTFEVIAANADGIWATDAGGLQVRIIVLPPWYRTWWALILWIMLLLSSLYALYRFQLSHRLAEAEALRLQELDQVKTRLYTNITHEFRTPLTIIQGMTSNISRKPDKWLESGLGMIGRNTKRLLELVNQMLDLTKLEAGRLPLQRIQADIIPFLFYLIESFHSYAETKGVSVHILLEIQEVLMDYDPDKLTDVISNLLSNAIKFTPEGGQVYFSILKENQRLILTIKDTGIGIPKDKLPYIFDRFYQADDSSTRKGEGTGIGLSLTIELVKLMGGIIHVDSLSGEGSEFRVELPITQTATLTQQVPQMSVLENERVSEDKGEEHVFSGNETDPSWPLVLIIEDNRDVVHYLISCMEARYQILIARNGQEGIDKALEQIPDLIISDVMMPEKDGFEVCEILKQNRLTSHIPIILLTARADEPSRLSGFKTGADAYLVKPFLEEELLIRMQNLLELCQSLQEKYSKAAHQPSLTEAATVPLTIEDRFLWELQDIIQANMSDPELTVPKLCRLIGMSRTQLHRKLTALLGKSATKVIRETRLGKARELLLHSNLNISQIGYDVGFKNPNWFGRAFSDQYGMSPTEFRKQGE